MLRRSLGQVPSLGLRGRLLAVVVLSLVPTGALMGYVTAEHVRMEMDDVRAASLNLAKLAAEDQEGLRDGASDFLQALALLPEVRAGGEACHRTLKALLDGDKAYGDLGVAGLDGGLRCTARGDDSVHVGDRSFFREAVQRGAFAAGRFEYDPLLRRPTVTMGYPVRADDGAGEVVGVVFAGLDLDAVTRGVAEARLPPGSAVVLLDLDGKLMVRHPSEGAMGTKYVPAAIVAAAVQQREGVAEAVGADGVTRLYAHVPVHGPDGAPDAILVVGLPVGAAFADAAWLLERDLGALLLGGALTLGLVMAASERYVLRKASRLAAAATALAGGDLRARAGGPHDATEMGSLARAFDHMADALQGHIEAERAALEERRRVEAALRKATRRLEEQDDFRRRFVSVAAHELRNPLTPAMLQVGLLREAPNLDAAQRAQLGLVERNLARLARLVGDLLQAARLDAGGLVLARRGIDLREAVLHAAEEAAAVAAGEGVRFACEAPAPMPVVADPDRLGQVLHNLLSNAIRFTGRGGAVTLRAAVQGREAVVLVEDTGPGLDAGQLARLFQPFARVHGPGGPGGTGLGLYISKGIVEQHGGRLWASSPGPGLGSTFGVALPLAGPPPEAPPAPRGPGAVG